MIVAIKRHREVFPNTCQRRRKTSSIITKTVLAFVRVISFFICSFCCTLLLNIKRFRAEVKGEIHLDSLMIFTERLGGSENHLIQHTERASMQESIGPILLNTVPIVFITRRLERWCWNSLLAQHTDRHYRKTLLS